MTSKMAGPKAQSSSRMGHSIRKLESIWTTLHQHTSTWGAFASDDRCVPPPPPKKKEGIARAVIYNMKDYLTSIVTRYCSLARESDWKGSCASQGRHTIYPMKIIRSLWLVARRLRVPHHTCPWCQHSFPQASTNQLLTGSRATSTNVGAGSGGPKKKQVKAPDEAPAGKLQTAAASILMGILVCGSHGSL